MPYLIEVIAIKEDLYNSLESACETLNKVQDEFIFQPPPERLRDKAFLQKQDKYHTDDLFKWLKEYRAEAKGNRPYLILVVDGFLLSRRLNNLFGNSRASEGLAIFTIESFDQFINDKIRFCRYYL